MNIVGNEREMKHENNSITHDVRRELGAFLFPKGSTIFPKIGGAIATNKKRLTTIDCCVDNNVMGVIPRSGKVDSNFLFYFFLAHDLSEFANEAHLPSIKKTVVESWPITLPAKVAEQQRIVAILDEAFADIATAKANAEKNLQKARELFNGRLASLFAGFQDNRMLGEICQTSAGGTPLSSKKEYYEKGLIPWIMSGEVDRKEISAATKFITQSGLENSSAKLFPENTVLVAMYGATAGQVGILRIRAATNQAVCGVLPNEKFLPEFLYFLFLDRKELLVSQAAGNAQPNISQAKIRTLGVPCPSLEDQESVVVELDKMTRELERLESLYARKLVALDELKQSLLQRAFSGQLS